jgi:hypothetical protein
LANFGKRSSVGSEVWWAKSFFFHFFSVFFMGLFIGFSLVFHRFSTGFQRFSSGYALFPLVLLDFHWMSAGFTGFHASFFAASTRIQIFLEISGGHETIRNIKESPAEAGHRKHSVNNNYKLHSKS